MHENQITGRILGCAFKVHTRLGPGLLESAYKESLYYELIKEGLYVVKEKAMPLIYDEVNLEIGYRIDLFVENKIVVEIKSVDSINDIHLAQVLTYMKLAETKIGLLLNFNVMSMKNGVKRVINTLRYSEKNTV